MADHEEKQGVPVFVPARVSLEGQVEVEGWPDAGADLGTGRWFHSGRHVVLIGIEPHHLNEHRVFKSPSLKPLSTRVDVKKVNKLAQVATKRERQLIELADSISAAADKATSQVNGAIDRIVENRRLMATARTATETEADR